MPLNGGRASVLVAEQGISNYFWTDDATAVYYQVSADKSKERVDDSWEKNWYVKRKAAENDFPKNKNDDQIRLSTADGAGFLSEKITRVKKVLLTTKESATIFETDLEIHLEAIMEKSKVYSIPQRRNRTRMALWKYAVCVWSDNESSITHLNLICLKGLILFAAFIWQTNCMLLWGNDLTVDGFATQEDLYLMDLETKEVAQPPQMNEWLLVTAIRSSVIFNKKIVVFPE